MRTADLAQELNRDLWKTARTRVVGDMRMFTADLAQELNCDLWEKPLDKPLVNS